MATVLPMQKISINGGPEVDGRVSQWFGDGLKSWDGEVRSYHYAEVGHEVTVMVWGPQVLLGRAMMTSCEADQHGTAVSRFQGNGPLRSFTHKQLEAFMALFPDEEQA